jgi:RNA polymerase sigma factor (sigma-70 family)
VEKSEKDIHHKLVKQCRRGNRKAQFELYQLFYKQMYNASLRIVNDTQEAEDIMQESFLTAFEKLDTYRGEVPIGAWIRRIVVNRSLDALRKRKVDFETPDEIKDVPEETVEFEAELSVEQVKECMMELPDNARTILSLYLLEGYDHEEISQIMNITNSTARSQYARARKKLQEKIKEKVELTQF